MARRPASPNASGGSGPSSGRGTTRSRHDADGPVSGTHATRGTRATLATRGKPGRHVMNAASAAALIAAVFWALLVSVGVFVLFRLARLLNESSRLVAEVRDRSDTLLQRAQTAVDGAQSAVDRANTQLDRTESVTASMDDLGAG